MAADDKMTVAYADGFCSSVIFHHGNMHHSVPGMPELRIML